MKTLLLIVLLLPSCVSLSPANVGDLMNLAGTLVGCIHEEDMTSARCQKQCAEQGMKWCPSYIAKHKKQCLADRTLWWCPSDLEKYL